jgi:hypothetical protein
MDVLVGICHFYPPSHREVAKAVWYRRLVVLNHSRRCRWSNREFCAAMLLVLMLSVLLRLCFASLPITGRLLTALRWAL